jgi:hypothetical protein
MIFPFQSGSCHPERSEGPGSWAPRSFAALRMTRPVVIGNLHQDARNAADLIIFHN